MAAQGRAALRQLVADPNASPYNEVSSARQLGPMALTTHSGQHVPAYPGVGAGSVGEFKDPVPRFLVSLDNQADTHCQVHGTGRVQAEGTC